MCRELPIEDTFTGSVKLWPARKHFNGPSFATLASHSLIFLREINKHKVVA